MYGGRKASGARRREDGRPEGRGAASASGSVYDSHLEGRAQRRLATIPTFKLKG